MKKDNSRKYIIWERSC